MIVGASDGDNNVLLRGTALSIGDGESEGFDALLALSEESTEESLTEYSQEMEARPSAVLSSVMEALRVPRASAGELETTTESESVRSRSLTEKDPLDVREVVSSPVEASGSSVTEPEKRLEVSEETRG